MPAWKGGLSEREAWQATTFLSRMDKLSPQVSAEWKTAAAANQPPDAPIPETKEKKSMTMPTH